MTLPTNPRVVARPTSKGQVTEAENGKVGVQLYRTQQPEVVITDLFMPEQDGIETIQELARQIPRPWVVAISGGGRHGIDMLEAAQELGASKVLRSRFVAGSSWTRPVSEPPPDDGPDVTGQTHVTSR